MDAPLTSENTAFPVIPASASAATRAGNQGLFLIAIFELVKTVLFLIAAAGVFHIVNRDTQVELTKLLHVFRINGDWRLVKFLLSQSNIIDPYKLRISIVLVIYAMLHATEGIGLLLRKRWAEYFTVIMTAIPLPYEVWLLLHHTAHVHAAEGGLPAHPLFGRHIYLLKIAVLLINASIVWFLAYHLRRGLQLEHAARAAAGGSAPA